MATLHALKDLQCQITLHCQGFCTHAWSPSWDQLIQYFGPDYDLASRDHWDRLVCERCGHRGALVILQPPAATSGVNSGIGGHSSGSVDISVVESARRAVDRETERNRLGIRSNVEKATEARQFGKRHVMEKKGSQLIGPPSPWAHRKRGRWL